MNVWVIPIIDDHNLQNMNDKPLKYSIPFYAVEHAFFNSKIVLGYFVFNKNQAKCRWVWVVRGVGGEGGQSNEFLISEPPRPSMEENADI